MSGSTYPNSNNFPVTFSWFDAITYFQVSLSADGQESGQSASDTPVLEGSQMKHLQVQASTLPVVLGDSDQSGENWKPWVVLGVHRSQHQKVELRRKRSQLVFLRIKKKKVRQCRTFESYINPVSPQ